MTVMREIDDFLLPANTRSLLPDLGDEKVGKFPYPQTVQMVYEKDTKLWITLMGKPLLYHEVSGWEDAKNLMYELEENNGWPMHMLPYIEANYLGVPPSSLVIPDYQKTLLYAWENNMLHPTKHVLGPGGISELCEWVDFPLTISLKPKDPTVDSAATCNVKRPHPLSSDISVHIVVEGLDNKPGHCHTSLVLHELAHAIDARRFLAYGHGPSFCLIYSILLREFGVGVDPASSMQSMCLSLPLHQDELFVIPY